MMIEESAIRIVLLTALCLFSTAAGAESANQFLAQYDAAERSSSTERSIWRGHVLDTENGFSWANSMMHVERHITPLYCKPGTAEFTGEQLVDVLRRYLEENNDLGSKPMALVLMMALQKDYPCKAQQK
jgi:hypothetical protein